MIIGTVTRKSNTLIFQELQSSNLVNNITINELCKIISEKIGYGCNFDELKIAIVDTERKNIFHFSVASVTYSINLELDNE